jgi:hypothetical protein
MNYYPFTLDWILQSVVLEQNRHRRISSFKLKPHRTRRHILPKH